MALIRALSGSGGGAEGFIVSENSIPNTGTLHVYEYKCTNATGFLKISHTTFIEFSLVNGVFDTKYVSTEYSNTDVSYSNGTLTVTFPNSYWGNSFYMAGW